MNKKWIHANNVCDNFTILMKTIKLENYMSLKTIQSSDQDQKEINLTIVKGLEYFVHTHPPPHTYTHTHTHFHDALGSLRNVGFENRVR